MVLLKKHGGEKMWYQLRLMALLTLLVLLLWNTTSETPHVRWLWRWARPRCLEDRQNHRGHTCHAFHGHFVLESRGLSVARRYKSLGRESSVLPYLPGSEQF